MTKATRVVLIVGLLLVLLAALFPPMTFVYPRQGDNFYFCGPSINPSPPGRPATPTRNRVSYQ